MSVNSVNSLSSRSASSSSALSQETINKLKALGLDPTKYSSEAQAQQAITEKTEQNNSSSSSSQKSGSSNFATIKTEVQDLASKMGIYVESNDKIDDILSKISDKISELEGTAGSDQAKEAEVNGYQNEYTIISAELSQLEASRSMAGASAMASYNKAALGLS